MITRELGLAVVLALAALVLPTNSVQAQMNPPLEMVLESTRDTVAPGETIVYRVHVSNVSTTVPTGKFQVIGEVPEHMLVTSVVDGSCGSNCRFGKPIKWNVPVLGPGQSVVLEFVGVVDMSTQYPPPPDGTKLVAKVTTTLGGSSETRTQSTTVASKRVFDVAVTGTPHRVAAGKAVAYTLSFGNRSGSAVNAVLRVPVPANMSFVSASGGGALKSNVVEWPLGKLGAGTIDRRRLVLKAGKSAAPGALLALEAEIATDKAERSARATLVTVVGSDEPLSMAVRGPDPLLPGEVGVYTIDVGNAHGSTPTGNFVVTANVPRHLLVTDVRDGSCGSNCRYGKKIRWKVPSLAPGQNAALQFVAVIDNTAAAPPPPYGAVLAFDSYTPLFGGVSATHAIAIGDRSKLALGMGVELNRVPTRGETAYTIAFGNTAAASKPVTLRVRVPAAAAIVSATDGGVTSDDVIEWSLGSIPSGFGDRRRFTVKVKSATKAGAILAPEAELVDQQSGVSLVRAVTSSVVSDVSPFGLKFASTPVLLTPGATIIYNTELTNLSTTTPMAKLVVTGTVPRNVLVKDVAAGSCGSNCRYGKWITWRVAALAASGKVALAQTTVVDNSAVAPPPPTGSVLQSEVMVPFAGVTRTDLLQFVGTDKNVGKGGVDIVAPKPHPAPAKPAPVAEAKPKADAAPTKPAVAAKPAPIAEAKPKPATTAPADTTSKPKKKKKNTLSIRAEGSANVEIK